VEGKKCAGGGRKRNESFLSEQQTSRKKKKGKERKTKGVPRQKTNFKLNMRKRLD